jgi:hypothetical protein
VRTHKDKGGDNKKTAAKKGHVPPVISPLEAAILESATQLHHSGIKDDSFQKILHGRLQSSGAKKLWNARIGSKGTKG